MKMQENATSEAIEYTQPLPEKDFDSKHPPPHPFPEPSHPSDFEVNDNPGDDDHTPPYPPPSCNTSPMLGFLADMMAQGSDTAPDLQSKEPIESRVLLKRVEKLLEIHKQELMAREAEAGKMIEEGFRARQNLEQEKMALRGRMVRLTESYIC